MEQYENNSLNNCTDNNEFHSQQPADADFKTPREEQPAGGAEATFSQSQPEESRMRPSSLRRGTSPPAPITTPERGGRNPPLPTPPM